MTYYITAEEIYDASNNNPSYEGYKTTSYRFDNNAKNTFEELFGDLGMEVCYDDVDKWLKSGAAHLNTLESVIYNEEDFEKWNRGLWSWSSTSSLIRGFVEVYKPKSKVRLVDKIVAQAKI